ncbi:MAG: glycosyltransferase family 4 protein [Candidatus Accumulibacter sp.]|jgi:glycosyltransferase involved in cell wall biosynthesis|uniref:Glycosyltransferase family 4 protein n=1 Tax=Candidatus Accumulibacter proximus TaxID=2954385 RepID=A0A935PWE6_9PROT|nr:glycosyltransferase family 4 protein [Candidatus Accumulibacter proximus]
MNYPALSPPLANPPLRVCFIQPVQSPYWTERLRVLAQNNNLDLTLLLEREGFAHRPGWQPATIEGVSVRVLGSKVRKTVSKRDDHGYQIHGNRLIPWNLPYWLWRYRPDVLVVCNATQLLLSLPYRWFFNIRVAITVEDTPHATRNLGHFTRWIKGLIYRRADCWFAFSEDAKQFLRQIRISKGVVRSSWSLDMSSFLPKYTMNASTDKYDNGSEARTVLFVGQLIPRKGVMGLLQAWNELAAETRSRSQLHLIGDGPLREQVANYIHDHKLDEVRIIGQIPYDMVRNLLSSADLFVLPTLEDLFSLTVVEAMACGCAVVTTPFNGARELVQQGMNGWIVDPIQSGALTTVLERALSEQTNLKEMGTAARHRVENMDNTNVMTQFAQDLRNLAPGHG